MLDLHWALKHIALKQARNQGGQAPLEKFSPPLKKCVGCRLIKTIGHS